MLAKSGNFFKVFPGYILKKLLEKHNLQVRIVHGLHDGVRRMQLARAIDQGKLDILLCSRVYNEGIDIPGLSSAINAAGYKAIIPTTQKPGRGMRVKPGKSKFVFVDFIDRHHRKLLEHSRKRAETYKQCGFQIHTLTSIKAFPKLVQRYNLPSSIFW